MPLTTAVSPAIAFAPLITDGPIILLVVFFLTQLPPTLLELLRLGGGLYLLYLAARLLRRLGHAGPTLRAAPQAAEEIGEPVRETTLSPELRAAIVLFYSLLDEKQRRLYAGLEAHKLGHGGDRHMADFLGIGVHTVARGRQELFSNRVQRDRVRSAGGGRKAVEKKRPK